MTELLTVWKDGKPYAMTPETFADELTYRNYRHNRRLHPTTSPERWAKVYPDVESMERRFQAEHGH